MDNNRARELAGLERLDEVSEDKEITSMINDLSAFLATYFDIDIRDYPSLLKRNKKLGKARVLKNFKKLIKDLDEVVKDKS